MLRIVGERAIISAQLAAVRGKWTQFAEMRGDARSHFGFIAPRRARAREAVLGSSPRLSREHVVMLSIGHDRREFIAKSFCIAGSLAAFGLRPAAAQAQTAPRPIRRSERYDDSFITERKPFKWPGNNTLAVWFAPNVEVWQFDSASGIGITPNPTNHVPDVFNYAWREYGMRVGLWRIADVFDEAGVKATVALNSQVCDVYPKAIDEMKKRGWEIMGHGTTNSTNPAGLNPDQDPDATGGILQPIE